MGQGGHDSRTRAEENLNTWLEASGSYWAKLNQFFIIQEFIIIFFNTGSHLAPAIFELPIEDARLERVTFLLLPPQC